MGEVRRESEQGLHKQKQQVTRRNDYFRITHSATFKVQKTQMNIICLVQTIQDVDEGGS